MRNFPKLLFSLNFIYIALIAAQVAAIIFLCLYIPALMPVALTVSAAWVITLITAAVLFARDAAAEVKCAWFMLICALPVVGAVIYIISAVKLRSCGILKVNGGSQTGLSAAAADLCGTVSAGYDSAKYFSDGRTFLNEVCAAVSKAHKSVYMEFFIIARGQVFNSLLQALKSAKRNGAEIKIIFDGIGSLTKLSKKDVKKLKDAGAEVKTFHKLTPYPRANLNFRDHRKIVSIDGLTAFTGGINLADEYANITSPFGYWKDSGLCIKGGAALIFEGMFLSVWNKKHQMDAPAEGKNSCLPFYDSPHGRAFFEDACVCAVNAATQRVHIMTPYFCLSEKTAAALSFAARRGVDVKVIIPHTPDKKYAFEISKTYASELKPSGVKFYEFTPGFMHAKCLVCDDSVFLGSYNFDNRSTRLNYECGVMFKGQMTQEAERDFCSCLELSAEFNEGKISFLRKSYRFVLRLIAPLI